MSRKRKRQIIQLDSPEEYPTYEPDCQEFERGDQIAIPIRKQVGWKNAKKSVGFFRSVEEEEDDDDEEDSDSGGEYFSTTTTRRSRRKKKKPKEKNEDSKGHESPLKQIKRTIVKFEEDFSIETQHNYPKLQKFRVIEYKENETSLKGFFAKMFSCKNNLPRGNNVNEGRRDNDFSPAAYLEKSQEMTRKVEEIDLLNRFVEGVMLVECLEKNRREYGEDEDEVEKELLLQPSVTYTGGIFGSGGFKKGWKNLLLQLRRGGSLLLHNLCFQIAFSKKVTRRPIYEVKDGIPTLCLVVLERPNLSYKAVYNISDNLYKFLWKLGDVYDKPDVEYDNTKSFPFKIIYPNDRAETKYFVPGKVEMGQGDYLTSVELKTEKILQEKFDAWKKGHEAHKLMTSLRKQTVQNPDLVVGSSPSMEKNAI